MLQIKNLSKTYKNETKKALNNVSLSINQGEFVALLGQNGAGKSTLINVLAGNVIKDTGTIFIGDYNLDINELETKQIIGIVPQEISFDFVFTVNEILKNQSRYFGITNNQKYIDELLVTLSLSEKKDTKSRGLSGGMKRRLLIAKALIHRPKLLILDEPTAGVDIELRRSLYKFLNELHRLGTTIILTTHYLEEAEKLCDRIIVINEGVIIADDSKEKLMKNLGNEAIVEFDFGNDINLNDFEFLNNYKPMIINKTTLQLKAEKQDIANIFYKMAENNMKFTNFKIEHKKLEDVFLTLVNNREN